MQALWYITIGLVFLFNKDYICIKVYYMIGLLSEMVKLRKARGISQKDMAERIGCSACYLSQVEKGRKVNEVKYSLLQDYCTVLDVPLEAMSFFTMDDSYLKKEDVEAYNRLRPALLAAVYEFFTWNEQ